MTLLAWLMGIGILVYSFNEMFYKTPAPQFTQDNGISSVRLKADRLGHFNIPGQINGTSVTFLMDTGATSVSIPEAIADEIGLEKGFPVVVQTANGDIQVYLTSIDRLNIAGLELRNIRGSINPHADRHDPILLGMTALKNLRISQQNGWLTLSTQ